LYSDNGNANQGLKFSIFLGKYAGKKKVLRQAKSNCPVRRKYTANGTAWKFPVSMKFGI
jgi:hypothetical protein